MRIGRRPTAGACRRWLLAAGGAVAIAVGAGGARAAGGALDPSFGTGGKVLTDLGSASDD